MTVGSKHTFIVWTVAALLIGGAYVTDAISLMMAFLCMTVALFVGVEMGHIAQKQNEKS